MGYRDEYCKKLISPREAAGLVKSGMWIDYGFHSGFPLLIDEELARRAHELEEVKIRAYWHRKAPQVLKADSQQEHFIYNAWLFSRREREYHKMGCCSYIPSQLGDTPRLYREYLKGAVAIAFIEVTPMDEHGYFNFGASIGYQKALCDAAQTVVVEVNESQPWVYGGYDEAIHISQVDYVVENNQCEIAEIPVARVTKTDEEIAAQIVNLIEDESTIQLGAGSIPAALGNLLIEKRPRDLGIHSGLFNDSMVDLIEAGVVTNRKKTINPGKAVFTAAVGTKRLYQYINRNPRLAGFPSDYTHNPYVIAQNQKQIAINGALKVDLQGQVCSESIGYHHISGTGGQLELIRGAYLSPGGKAFICLPATYKNKEGKLASNIVLTPEPGDVVTVPRTDVSYIVTEFGVVNLKGKSSWQRAKLLISISHPDFRDELVEAARRVNLTTSGTAKLRYGD